MRLFREQPQRTAGYHQLGDPCYYYVLSWASPPVSLNGLITYVSQLTITKFDNFGKIELVFEAKILLPPNEGGDRRRGVA